MSRSPRADRTPDKSAAERWAAPRTGRGHDIVVGRDRLARRPRQPIAFPRRALIAGALSQHRIEPEKNDTGDHRQNDDFHELTIGHLG